MNLAPGSVTALAAAQPGWTVTIEWSGDKHPNEHYPIVAWAAATMESDKSGLCTTRMESVFFHSEAGTVYTESDYQSDMRIASFGRARLAFKLNPPGVVPGAS
ncbi:hypothetical protein [Streptomyces sp. SM13]|uniref:hypothetical protein n=1 Tax=Streptomyces sp. SM13 TaxID=1983803 RepID=UPI000CD5169D|nr:hypothetical protein [Streptomyces sp. SM13]